jgi:hypothetical protein
VEVLALLPRAALLLERGPLEVWQQGEHRTVWPLEQGAFSLQVPLFSFLVGRAVSNTGHPFNTKKVAVKNAAAKAPRKTAKKSAPMKMPL